MRILSDFHQNPSASRSIDTSVEVRFLALRVVWGQIYQIEHIGNIIIVESHF